MKKYFLFGITMLSAAVIIGTIITFINANQNEVASNSSMQAETDNSIEQRLAELEKKVSALETLTITQNEEIASLQNELKENLSKPETTIIYKDNNSTKVSELGKKVNELEKKNDEQGTAEINKKVEEVSKEVKGISEDYYWMEGKWEGINKERGAIYQFDLRKDGIAYDKEGNKIGTWSNDSVYYEYDAKGYYYRINFRKFDNDNCVAIGEVNSGRSYSQSLCAELKKVDSFSKIDFPESILLEGKTEISLEGQEIKNENYNIKVAPSYITNIKLKEVSVDNEDVATINSSGYNEVSITINKTGEFTLTVTTENGKTASIKVKVTE